MRLRMAGMMLAVLYTGSVWAASTLVLAAPQGGEVYVPGKTATVSFVPLSVFTSIKVELSRDGTTFTALGTVNAPLVNQVSSLNWTVAAPTTSSAYVRLTGLPGNVVISSSAFSISALGAGGLLDGSVTTAKLADKSVTTAKLADKAVTNAKLGDAAVTNIKLAANAVTNDKISSGPASANYVLASNGLGGTQWIAPSFGWSLTGNANTIPGVNFLGTLDFAPLELRVNNQRAVTYQFTPDSPNIVAGHASNYINTETYGSVVGGGGETNAPNGVSAKFSVVAGGRGNLANNEYSAILGGNFNATYGINNVVVGGQNNTVVADFSAIVSGAGNVINPLGQTSIIGGGAGNSINEQIGVIAGGLGNVIDSDTSTIGGGTSNRIGAGGAQSTIGGGYQNVTEGFVATISGGSRNHAKQGASVAGGEFNRASEQSFIGGGSSNSSNAFLTVIGGGNNNANNGFCSVLGGGSGNFINAGGSVIAGGTGNSIEGGGDAVIGGGSRNRVLAGSLQGVIGGATITR